MNSSQRSLYRYETLKTSTSVRFLRITGYRSWYGEIDDEPYLQDLQYELVEHDLRTIEMGLWTSSVQYNAISYAWGTAPRSKHLQLSNQQYLLITPGLEAAIPHLALAARDHHDSLDEKSFPMSRLVWIDQVCIDQDNTTEREQQVRLMQDLYSKAYYVLVWLGGNDDHTEKVFEMVKVVSRSVSNQEIKEQQRKQLEKYLGQKESGSTSLQDFNDYENALLAFFDRPWFQRAWTFQEAVLPKRVVFLAGNGAVGMQDLSWTLEAMGHTRMGKMVRLARLSNTDAASGYESFLAMETLKYQISGKRPVHEFLHILSELAPYKKATDARDLCFAFLGFQKNAKINIRPNYSSDSTTEYVYTYTAKEIVDGSSSLEIFGVLHRGQTKTLMHSLPAWVPDWSAEPLTIPLRASHIPSYFSACNGYYHIPTPCDMMVQGRIVDVVLSVHTTGAFPHPPLQAFDIRDVKIRDLFNLERFEMEVNLKSGAEKQTLSRARLLRTLLADGANPGPFENILQREAAGGLDEWRIKELLKAYDQWETIQSKTQDPANYESKLDAEALLAYGGVMKNRSLITTKSLRLGIAASSVRPDDVVCILHGSHTPIILRQQGNGKFIVIGQAYVEGVMRGEVVDWDPDEGNVFELV